MNGLCQMLNLLQQSTILSKVYIDAQWDPEEGNLGTLPVAMQVLFSLKFCFIRDHSH